MELSFYKYQGTGNDFVMVDNRKKLMSKNNTKLVEHLCDRKFGIGADGLILLEEEDDASADFRMVYFNSDGKQSSMCGNGGRCIIAFAKFLGIIDNSCSFTAIDGIHEGIIGEDGQVGLKMNDVEDIFKSSDYSFLDTGSPHHVIFSDEIAGLDVNKEGSAIRYSELYKQQGGSNVNFVEVLNESALRIRTYERGVEDETLSCGTGATAAAIAAFSSGAITTETVQLQTEGGKLQVKFRPKDNGFSHIWLLGPALQVFKGEIVC